MIVVPQDEAGLRMAAMEMFEYSAFEAPQRERNARLAEMSADPQAVLRATESERALSPGYYMWVQFLIEAIEEPMEAGLVLNESKMDAEELLGLQALRAARAEFRRKHPPCRECGMALRHEHDTTCNDCQKAAAAAARAA